MADEQTCETCRYWSSCESGDTIAPPDMGNSGECRRHSPTRVMADALDALATFAKHNGEYDDDNGPWQQTRRLFPLTYCWDWCGEWQGGGHD